MEFGYKTKENEEENVLDSSEKTQINEELFSLYHQEPIFEQELPDKMTEYLEILKTEDKTNKIKSALLFFADNLDKLISMEILNPAQDLIHLLMIILNIINERKIDTEAYLFSLFIIRQSLIEYKLLIEPTEFLTIHNICHNILEKCQFILETEERLIIHCFEIILELFKRRKQIESYQQTEFPPILQLIINILNNPESYSQPILMKAFDLCTTLYQTHWQIYTHFLRLNFVEICLNYIRIRNEITPFALNSFSMIFKRCDEAIEQFPEDFLGLFASLIFEEVNPSITEAAIQCLDEMSISTEFRRWILEIPNVIFNLLTIDNSFTIRSSALRLVHSLFYEEDTSIMTHALEEFVDFTPFCHLIDTDDPKIIFQALEVLRLIVFKLKNLVPFPPILVTLLQTTELMEQLESIKTDDEDSQLSEIQNMLDEDINDVLQREDCPV